MHDSQRFPDNGVVTLRLLREKTRAQHEATESLLPLNNPGLDFQHYQQILQCFYSFVSRWESWAASHVPANLAALVTERRRSGLLERDFAFFSISPDFPEATSEPLLQALVDGLDSGSVKYEAAFLGSMYVLEGSTLGGQYIARNVEQNLGLSAGEGDAYFRGYGNQTMVKWGEFRQLLDAIPDEHSPIVIDAARVTFEYVQNILRSCPSAIGRTSSLS